MNDLLIPHVEARVFEEPTTFFTVDGEGCRNPRSCRVIEKMTILDTSYECIVCKTPDEARSIVGPRSVVIFDDDNLVARRFNTSYSLAVPPWGQGTPWCVRIGYRCSDENRYRSCAHQTRAHFRKRFRLEIDRGNFPWGQPKKNSSGLREIINIDPQAIEKTLNALNSGPNLAEAIADRAFALDLPKDSKISWVRVLHEPIGFLKETMESIVGAMRSFEKASHLLLGQDAEVKRVILGGVILRESRLRDVYLNPGVDCFTVTRPDLHWHTSGLSASENDEMPGGLPELVLLDTSYGMNEDRWRDFFSHLTVHGPLLFLVSHEWSKCYVPETKWLVSHLVQLGYDARLLMTDQLHELSVETDGVYHHGTRLGVIWRQFPIFETSGKLADLVFAAREGKVRMYPEWGHFGNKAWFHLFWKHQDWFKEHLSPTEMSLLQRVLPESRLIEDSRSFPVTIGKNRFSTVEELKNLPETIRNELVMKIVGANSLSARSYGVLMGRGISSTTWSDWIKARINGSEPFLVQKMFQTGIASLPVWHTKRNQSEMFRCRLLMRPWTLDGKIISVHGCAVPQECFKVHGMVSMAVTPIRLVSIRDFKLHG